MRGLVAGDVLHDRLRLAVLVDGIRSAIVKLVRSASAALAADQLTSLIRSNIRIPSFRLG